MASGSSLSVCRERIERHVSLSTPKNLSCADGRGSPARSAQYRPETDDVTARPKNNLSYFPQRQSATEMPSYNYSQGVPQSYNVVSTSKYGWSRQIRRKFPVSSGKVPTRRFLTRIGPWEEDKLAVPRNQQSLNM